MQIGNNEAKPAIIHINNVNPAGDYERTLKCLWPKVCPEYIFRIFLCRVMCSLWQCGFFQLIHILLLRLIWHVAYLLENMLNFKEMFLSWFYLLTANKNLPNLYTEYVVNSCFYSWKYKRSIYTWDQTYTPENTQYFLLKQT